MRKKSKFQFEQVQEPITEAISKFGGQPNWINKPEWPVDKKKGKKMYFVGQIELVNALFGETKGKMAYIFFDADDNGDQTWDPHSGQNAVIIQPGTNEIPTVPDSEGPQAEFNEEAEGVDETGLCEFKLCISIDTELDYLNEEQIDTLIDSDEAKYDKYSQAMEVSKIGGNPFFIQNEEIPIEGQWKLLCQLDQSDIPVYVNFGTGVAYAFIDSEGTHGKILWQC